MNNIIELTNIVKTYHSPGGPGIRIDSSLYTGCNITSFYDGLLSKIISTGKSRKESIMRLKRALNEYVIEGVETNIPLLIDIINEKDFSDGNFNISWVENTQSS